MRKLLQIGVLLVFSQQITQAQELAEYLPTFVDGRKWIVEKTVRDPKHNNPGMATYTVVGDTTVCGLACKKVHYEKPYLYNPAVVQNYQEFKSGDIACYEKDGVVYTVTESTSEPGTPKLWAEYDYSVSAGYKLPGSDWISVYCTDTVEVRGVKRRRVFVGVVGGANVWVEGIGADYCYMSLYPPSLVLHQAFYIREVYDGDELIFSSDDFYIDLPPQLAGIDTIVSDPEATTDSTIYDLTGRQVTKPQRGNIYIRGGKKILWQND